MLHAVLEYIANVTPFFFALRDAGLPYLFDPKWIATYMEADTEIRLAELRKAKHES